MTGADKHTVRSKQLESIRINQLGPHIVISAILMVKSNPGFSVGG